MSRGGATLAAGLRLNPETAYACRLRPPEDEDSVTPQEQELLVSLTQKINQTELQEKDPDAENLLGRELGANPDAIYILAQTVLVQNIALDQARAQIAQLQQQVQQARQQPAHTTSFLGRLLGEKDEEPAPANRISQGSGGWAAGSAQAPPYQPVPQYTQPQYAPPPPQYAAPAPYPPQQYVGVPGGQPSFLRGAMQTAAGVAAGALAFEGVESILHGFGHGGGYGMAGMGMAPGLGMGGGFERPVEETVINNYYDEPGGGRREFEHERSEGEHHVHEDSDRGGGAQFSDASYERSGDRSHGDRDDQMGFDDNSSSHDDHGGDDDRGGDDGTGFDDLGGLDDGCGFDDGGGFDNGGNDLV